jgi:hypothetical protein
LEGKISWVFNVFTLGPMAQATLVPNDDWEFVVNEMTLKPMLFCGPIMIATELGIIHKKM